MQRLTEKRIRKILTETSLGWKCFVLYNTDREIYSFKNKFLRDFIRKSIKGGTVRALKRYFESILFDEKLLTIRKHLNLYDDNISIVTENYIDNIGKNETKYQTMSIGNENIYRKIDEKKMEEFVNSKLDDLEISKDQQKFNKVDLLVSHDFKVNI